MTGMTSLEPLVRISTLGTVGDPDVGDGVHIAVSMNPIIGWPLHPFICGMFEPEPVFDVTADYFDQAGNPLTPPFAIEKYGTVEVVLRGRPGAPDDPWCWIKTIIEGNGAVVDAIDPVGPGRSFARRTAAPYSFGASSIRRLRLSGRGTVSGVSGVPARCGVEFARSFQWLRPFGLPVDGEASWYAGGQGEATAIDRVAMGAPTLLGPPDQPLGPGAPLTTGDEVTRIRKLHDAIRPWIEAAFYGPVVPDEAVLEQTAPANTPIPGADGVPAETLSTVSCVSALTIQSHDPGVARYLGMTTTAPIKAPSGDRPMLIVVGAYFGLDPSRRIGPWPLRDAVPADTALTQVLNDQAVQAFDLTAVRKAYERSREVRLLPVVAGVGATPDRPDAPVLSAPRGRWRPGRAGRPESWQQSIRLHGTPPAGPVAFARLSPGAVTSLHRFSGGRAIAMFAGKADNEPLPATPLLDRPGTVCDVSVPSHPDGGRWLVAQADRFGRWSKPASIAAPLPPRPAPRPPVLQIHVLTAELDENDGSALSPARLRVSVRVPAKTALEAGALPISGLRLTVGGTTKTYDASGTADVAASVPAPATLPAGSIDVTVSAVFTDTAGTPSTPAVSVVTVHDPRPYAPPKTGPALLWSGRRDVTGTSELALTWPSAGPDARYRVYLSNSDRLAPALGISLVDGRPANDPLRSSLAGAIWRRRAELRDKGAFSLITDAPLRPVDGVVSLRHGIPGSLRGVLFVRVVPVSKGGVEADFASCGLVPVAVPHSERPPAPTVHAVAGDDGRVTVRVEATGLSAPVLAGASPGRAPEVRIRRARRTVTDPLYVPVVGSASLTADPARPGTWTATLTDNPPGGLMPYERATYWAEVRYPAEPALPPGTVSVPSGDVATPPGVPAGDIESFWSAPSLPATATRVPATVPDIRGLLTFTRDATGDVISGTLPVTNGFTIQLWAQTPTGALKELVKTAAVHGFTHTEPPVVPPPVRYHVLLTDPLGRTGDLTAIEAN